MKENESITACLDNNAIEKIVQDPLEVENCLKNRNQRLSKLTSISPEDESKLLNEFQGKYLAYDKSATVLDLFAIQVQQRPDAIALVDATSKLTYSQTDAYTDQLARKLVSLAVAEDAPHEELTRPVADDLAYMIYTSGSTGRPKGVMIRCKREN